MPADVGRLALGSASSCQLQFASLTASGCCVCCTLETPVDCHLLDYDQFSGPSQVYKKYTGQMAALKFINKKGKGAKEVASLRQEMNILCTLEHENIIRWLEHFETDTDFVVVTELAQGATLTAPATPQF
jgi:serine/threonine protein kinase